MSWLFFLGVILLKAVIVNGEFIVMFKCGTEYTLYRKLFFVLPYVLLSQCMKFLSAFTGLLVK